MPSVICAANSQYQPTMTGWDRGEQSSYSTYKIRKGNPISEIPRSPLSRHIVDQNGITCERSVHAYHHGCSLQCGGLHHDDCCVLHHACRDAEPELERDDAQLEQVRACPCEHRVSHEPCCDHPCRLQPNFYCCIIRNFVAQGRKNLCKKTF